MAHGHVSQLDGAVAGVVGGAYHGPAPGTVPVQGRPRKGSDPVTIREHYRGAAHARTQDLRCLDAGRDRHACRASSARRSAESIRQEELRADLFFLAGDAMRGRLTDTVENLATADYIRARFERAGLKPAAPGDSYFQNYNLMTATLGEGNALEVHGADGAVAPASRTARSSTRSASAPAAR